MSTEQQNTAGIEMSTDNNSYSPAELINDLTRETANPGDFGYNNKLLEDNQFTAAGAVKNLEQLYSDEDIDAPRKIDRILEQWNNRYKRGALDDMVSLLEETEEEGLIEESDLTEWSMGNGHTHEVTVYQVLRE